MTPEQVPDYLLNLAAMVRLEYNPDGSREDLARFLADVLPAHEALVRAMVAAEQAQWLPEILHVVYGFAMGEHENIPKRPGRAGRPAALTRAHAETALQHVPGAVLDAARITRGGDL